MKIRRFRPSDTDRIARLFHETVREVNLGDYTQEQVKAWAPDDLHFRDWAEVCANRYTYVADDNGTIAGFAELEEDGHIDCFYCHKEYQRAGVGSRLYRALEEKALELGLTRLYTESSITAKPFFKKQGFTVIAEQTVETRGQHLTNYRMEKSLKKRLVIEQIGYWNEEGSEIEYIEPQMITAEWDPGIQSKVAEYLDNGRTAMQFMGYSWCRFQCGVPDERMGTRDLTDGRWIWPEGLSHYVREHDVRLPEPCISHMEYNGWNVPEIDPSDYELVIKSDLWLEFCRENRGLID